MIELLVTFFCMAIMGAVVIAAFIFKDHQFLGYEFGRFLLIGIFNTASNYFFYLILKPHMYFALAIILGYIISGIIAYLMTTYYVFNDRFKLETIKLFPLTFLPGLILSPIITVILVNNHVLGKNMATLVVMIIIVPLTYIIRKIIYERNQNKKIK